MVTARCAVRAGMPRQAPASKEVPSGSLTACSAGTTIYSAAVPKGCFHWPFQIPTRSPRRLSGTPGPTASISPAPSLCGITRGPAMGREPARVFQSDGLTPEARMRTRTSPGPGSGVSSSPTCRTSRAGPLRSYQAARMELSVSDVNLSDRIPGEHVGRDVERHEVAREGRDGVVRNGLGRPALAAMHGAHGPRLVEQKDLVVAHAEDLARDVRGIA